MHATKAGAVRFPVSGAQLPETSAPKNSLPSYQGGTEGGSPTSFCAPFRECAAPPGNVAS